MTIASTAIVNAACFCAINAIARNETAVYCTATNEAHNRFKQMLLGLDATSIKTAQRLAKPYAFFARPFGRARIRLE